MKIYLLAALLFASGCKKKTTANVKDITPGGATIVERITAEDEEFSGVFDASFNGTTIKMSFRVANLRGAPEWDATPLTNTNEASSDSSVVLKKTLVQSSRPGTFNITLDSAKNPYMHMDIRDGKIINLKYGSTKVQISNVNFTNTYVTSLDELPRAGIIDSPVSNGNAGGIPSGGSTNGGSTNGGMPRASTSCLILCDDAIYRCINSVPASYCNFEHLPIPYSSNNLCSNLVYRTQEDSCASEQ